MMERRSLLLGVPLLALAGRKIPTMTADQVLYKQLTVTLNASGAGSVSDGPVNRFEKWRIDRYITEGASTIEPSLNVYRSTAASVSIDSTPFGNQDVSETTTILELVEGERLIFSYTGGTAGAVMRIRIEGMQLSR